jgi:hypothetical protein
MANTPVDVAVMEFRVVLVLKTVDGKDIAYQTPVYKSTCQHGLGAALLQMTIARKLHDWIDSAFKEVKHGKG